MPVKNTIKNYVENGFYHVYNRGVEKRVIFEDEQDYTVFLYLLKFFLSPFTNNLMHPFLEIPNIVIRPRPLENLVEKVELHAYCLMPNHFHLIIKQITIDGMCSLMKKVCTCYSMYFNKRYIRVGHLFQGVYKANLVDKDEYIIHLSRYVHLNPLELTGFNPVSYPYSSYQYYLGNKYADWLKTEFILSYFSKDIKQARVIYRNFIEKSEEKSFFITKDLTLE